MTTLNVAPPGSFGTDAMIPGVLERVADDPGLTPEKGTWLASQSQQLVSRALDEPHRLTQMWEQLCELAYIAGAGILQPYRPAIEQSYQFKRENLALAVKLVSRVKNAVGIDLVGADRLPAAAEAIERFRAAVLDKWASLEDLEELLVESFPLSSADLKIVAAKSPPPQSWYDETDDLFEAES